MSDLTPYWPFIVMALNGLLAGWLASLLLGGGGLIRNLFVGIIGSFVGGLLLQAGMQLPEAVKPWVDMVPYGYGPQITFSTIGALLVIILARIIGR